MAGRFEVLRGRGGRWLVRDGPRRFAVPADLARNLRGPDGQRRWRGLLADHGDASSPRRRTRGLWLRVTVLPPSLVRGLSRPLARLAATPWLAGLALAGLLALAGAARRPVAGAAPWPAVLGVFLATALAHELGHAAALAREGWPPGGIGIGLLWFLPVGWCDVSAAALLPRRGRLRVDLGGVAFQLGAAGLAALVAVLIREPAALLGSRLAVAAVIWSLLPIARTDGYWLACDLLGLPDLDAPLTGAAGRSRRILAAAWRMLTAASLVALIGLLLWRLHGRFEVAPASGPWLVVVVRGVLGCMVLVGTLRAGRRIVRLVGAAWRDLRP